MGNLPLLLAIALLNYFYIFIYNNIKIHIITNKYIIHKTYYCIHVNIYIKPERRTLNNYGCTLGK